MSPKPGMSANVWLELQARLSTIMVVNSKRFIRYLPFGLTPGSTAGWTDLTLGTEASDARNVLRSALDSIWSALP